MNNDDDLFRFEGVRRKKETAKAACFEVMDGVVDIWIPLGQIREETATCVVTALWWARKSIADEIYREAVRFAGERLASTKTVLRNLLAKYEQEYPPAMDDLRELWKAAVEDLRILDDTWSEERE